MTIQNVYGRKRNVILFNDEIGDDCEVVFNIKLLSWLWRVICTNSKLKCNSYEWFKQSKDYLKMSENIVACCCAQNLNICMTFHLRTFTFKNYVFIISHSYGEDNSFEDNIAFIRL